VTSGAILSPCGDYRYLLWRTWAPGPVLGLGMLNPSTADHRVNDQTIRLGVGRAQRMGCGALYVWNLFAWRATDPRELLRVADPVGPDNAAALAYFLAVVDVVICAWGGDKAIRGRDQAALAAMRAAGHAPMAIGFTQAGHPLHPLRQPYERGPVPMPT
jgi:hypothetical protein